MEKRPSDTTLSEKLRRRSSHHVWLSNTLYRNSGSLVADLKTHQVDISPLFTVKGILSSDPTLDTAVVTSSSGQISAEEKVRGTTYRFIEPARPGWL